MPSDTPAPGRPDVASAPLPAGTPLREPTAPELARVAATAAQVALPTSAPVALAQVVPAPAVVEPDPGGDFTLTGTTAIIAAHPDALAVAEYLAELLRPATGAPLPVIGTDPPAPTGGITLALGEGEADPEGYRLDIAPEAVVITASAPAGLFYGVQTLRQLLPAAVESATPEAGPWVLPGGRIVDRPRYPYRGMMLDVARHFFDVGEVLRLIDHLARYKINHLHLHLTDDQGWRIAVDSWPRLGPEGGATEVGGGPGGHFSKADYRQIVAYAATRFITVVPEIDMPGHTHAAMATYGELAPDGTAPPPYTGTEVGFSALDPYREGTYAFVADVIGEIAELTPGPYLHIGGDEAFTMALADYVTFVDRAQAIVESTGKTLLGWHQLAPAQQRAGRILQYWGTVAGDGTLTDEAVVRDAVGRGARLILSPADRAYLDMKYAPETPIGLDWAGLIDVRRAYDWDPGSYLADIDPGAVLGVEAPLWTETVTSFAEVEFMVFPRLPAVAETAWSPAGRRDWADFRSRLAAHGPRWAAAGIGFHPSPEVPWPAAVPAPRPTPVPADHGLVVPE